MQSRYFFTLTFILPIVIILFLPIFPWKSLPGLGLNQTVNLITWAVISFWVGWLCFLLPTKRVTLNSFSLLLFIGLFFINLPAVWTPTQFRFDALYRFTGTSAIALLLYVLRQFPIRGGFRRMIIWIIVIAALSQSVLGALQVLYPISSARWTFYDFNAFGGRAVGGFRQSNLLGSFLATGLLSSLWLSCIIRNLFNKLLALVASIPISTVLILSESRTAWLGSIIGLAIIIGCAGSHKMRLLVILAIFLGLIGGGQARLLRPTMNSVLIEIDSLNAVVENIESVNPSLTVSKRLALDRQASNLERIMMLKGTVALIKRHPFKGNGIGSFETAFPEQLSRQRNINPFPRTVNYPHNELLYVLSEGGIIAFIGLVFWLCIWCTPFLSIIKLCHIKSFGYDKVRTTLIARGALTVPLMTHIMTEFPLYLSATHTVLLIILIWLSLPSIIYKTEILIIPPSLSRVLKILLFIISILGTVFTITGLQSAIKIQKAERLSLMNPTLLSEVWNRYAQQDRLQFDQAVSYLMLYNQTGDWSLLVHFQQIAASWLSRHNDANLIDSMMRISLANMDYTHFRYWRNRGCESFYTDPRFECKQFK